MEVVQVPLLFGGKNKEVGEDIWGLCLYVVIPVSGDKALQGRGCPCGVYNQLGMREAKLWFEHEVVEVCSCL